MNDKRAEIKELVDKLNQSSKVYYNSGDELMSNKEYDYLLEQLDSLEQETGIVFPDSPTQKPGYEAVEFLEKDQHEYPALSLDKTKDIHAFPNVFKALDGKAFVMWKMDGSTVVATYDNGALTKLVTRGNGEVGNIITHNAPFLEGLPLHIDLPGHHVVRGEAVMSYAEFERINSSLPEEAEHYKNPRNLATATIQLLDSAETSKRKISFRAFKLVHSDALHEACTLEEQFQWLSTHKFKVVEYKKCNVGELEKIMNEFSSRVDDYAFPVDGLVVAANAVEEAEKLPGTGKFPNKLVGYAFKWEDETAETVLRKIEWSPSRTGLINPVAVFDPVELEGTTVTRASIHNVSEVKRLRLRVGDKIAVYKANKIIPQVDANLTPGENLTYDESHPVVCPCCGCETNPLVSENDGHTVEVATCPNKDCAAKQVKRFVHFAERDCMNIVGLSEQTIAKFVERGFLKELKDFYELSRYREEIIKMDGFGEKSFEKLLTAISESQKTSFVPFIHALGIHGIGKGQAKLLNGRYHGDVMSFFEDALDRKWFHTIDGIGEVYEDAIWSFAKEKLSWMRLEGGNEVGISSINRELQGLLLYLVFEKEKAKAGSALDGKTFVITGTLNHYENRDALVKVIEDNGGKTSGSVSTKTTYLINNDVELTSGKNKKARELGIPVIAEEEFMEMLSKN